LSQATVAPRVEGEPFIVRSRDGTPIACWRRGSGPPLLLVHGSGEDHTRWRAIGAALARRCTVFAMDRRGHGASGDGDVHSLEAEADDIASVLGLAGAPAHLVGHSFGALCCLEAAAAGAAVRTLVLHEPCLSRPGSPVPSALSRRLDALLEAGEREAVVAAFFQDVVRAPGHRFGLLRSLPVYATLVASAHTLARELRATERHRFDPDRLRGQRVPVLLLIGRGLESPFLVEAVCQIGAALPSMRLEVLPADQHLGLDLVPGRVVDAIEAFTGSGS
jgi:pimeloyl-ACP methyl ester carboxylesterase